MVSSLCASRSTRKPIKRRGFEMSCNYICPTNIVQEIEAVPSTGYAPFYFPPEGDLLAFFFTADTFTRVYSALVNGSQLTYGNEGTQVLWDFLQNVEYPVTICEKMIDCITNDSDVRDALYNWLSTDPRAQNLIQGIVSKGSSGGGSVGVTAENDDALFGACTFLVDTMHDAIVDFNQKAELGTNLRERANIILQAIPVFGDAIASIPEYIDELFADVIEVFEGQYDTVPITGSRDRLRCGLFCLAQANDRALTWELVQTYFWDLVSFESTIPNLALDFVGFLATGSWAGQDVVNISFANMATAMTVGSKFGNAIFPNLQTIMSLGLNNPDGDWATVCEDCPPPVTGHWVIYTDNPFGGGQPCGTITSQDDHNVEFSSSLGSDGKYRISGLSDMCLSIVSGAITGTSGVTGDCGCGGYVGALIWPAGYEDRFYAISDNPFTMTGGF